MQLKTNVTKMLFFFFKDLMFTEAGSSMRQTEDVCHLFVVLEVKLCYEPHWLSLVSVLLKCE